MSLAAKSYVDSPSIPGVEVQERVSLSQNSVVFRATRAGEPVALKVIGARGDDDEFAIRFRREVCAIACITHPGIVKVVDVGSGPDFVYLLTEFIEGENLADVCKKGPQAREIVLSVAKQAASILAEIHRAGYVHRDIKPGNMMWMEGGRLKLLDFGLVHSATEAAPGEIAGTPAYMAPEQSGLLKRELDGRADLYSLGLVLYECATGKPAYVGQDAMELLRKHLQLVPDPPLKVNPHLGQALSAIITKLMAKDPDDRYQSADQLAHDLETIEALEAMGDEVAHRLGRAEASFKPRREALVGRAHELATLQHAWRSAQGGRAGVVIVEGESGSGKTRLCEEFLSGLAEETLVLRGKSHEFEHHPFGALNEAVTQFVATATPEARAWMKTAATVMPELLPALSTGLAEIVDARGRSQPESVSDDSLYLAVAEFICNLVRAAGRPCLIYLDDIQWLRRNGRETIARVLKDARGLPLLLLCSARGEEIHQVDVEAFKQRTDAIKPSTVRLTRLSEAEVGEMMASMLGGRQLEAGVLRKIASLADGNPYLAGQILRVLIDRGALLISAEHCSVDERVLSALDLSTGVQKLILGRLATLSRDGSALLRTAAILGRDFERKILSTVLDWPAQRFEEAVREALRSRIIEESGRDKLGFVHDNLVESLAKGAEGQEEIHRRAGDAYRTGGGLEHRFASAYHYCHAGAPAEPTSVFELTFRAGKEAAGVHAVDQAWLFLNFAYGLRAKVQAEPQLLADLCLQVAKLCRRYHKQDAELTFLNEALGLSKDPIFRALVRGEIANHHAFVASDFEKAEEVVAGALEELGFPLPAGKRDMLRDSFRHWIRAKIRARFGLEKPAFGGDLERYKAIAQLHWFYLSLVGFLNDGSKGIAIVLRNSSILEKVGVSPEGVSILTSLAATFYTLRRHAKADEYVARALEMGASLGDPAITTMTELNSAMNVHQGGDPVRSEKGLLRILATREKWMTVESYFHCTTDLAMNALSRGQWKLAARASSLALKKAEEGSFATLQGLPRLLYAAANAMLGNLEEASAHRKRVLASLRDNPNANRAPLIVACYKQTMLCYLIATGAGDDEIRDVLAEIAELKLDPRIGKSLPNILPVFAYSAWAYKTLFERKPTPERKEAWVKALAALKFAARVPNLNAHFSIQQAAYHRVEGRFKEAAKCLSAAEKVADAMDNRWVQVELLVERARLEALSGTGSSAHALAVGARALALQSGWQTRAEEIRREFNLEATAVVATPGASVRSTTQGTLQGLNKQRYLDALMKVSLASTGTLEPLDQARRMLGELITLLHAERAFLLVVDPATQKLTPYCGQTASGEALNSLDGFSQSVVAKVLETREPVILTGSETNGLAVAESVVAKGLKSVMAAPMFLRDQFAGVVCLDSQVVKGLFDASDLDIMNGISSHISIAMEMARVAALQAERAVMKKDLELTGAVQTLFFPKRNEFTEKTVSVAGTYKAATICSGDWWWHGIADGKVRVLLVDVMDHGAHSAMVTAMLATLVHRDLQYKTLSPVPELLSRMSQDLFQIVGDNYYATASAIEIDPETGKLSWWSAAAPQIVITSDDGQFQVLSEAGAPIGLSGNAPNIGFAEYQMREGDRVHLFSDGITEVVLPSGKPMLPRQLAKLLLQHHGLPLKAAGEELLRKLGEMAAGTAHIDDMTMIVAEYRVTPKRPV